MIMVITWRVWVGVLSIAMVYHHHYHHCYHHHHRHCWIHDNHLHLHIHHCDYKGLHGHRVLPLVVRHHRAAGLDALIPLRWWNVYRWWSLWWSWSWLRQWWSWWWCADLAIVPVFIHLGWKKIKKWNVFHFFLQFKTNSMLHFERSPRTSLLRSSIYLCPFPSFSAALFLISNINCSTTGWSWKENDAIVQTRPLLYK